ncbi:MAG: ATP-binding protein, partial [Gemmatimonadota bacterium]
DAGVTHPTVRSWISVLETSFIVFTAPPWLRNVRKRIVKAPKLHFIDSGVACHLLGIRDPSQLRVHPLRGPIFESWVAGEVLKARLHRGHSADLYHLRETRGVELDLVVEDGGRLIAVEAKSGATVASDFFDSLREFLDREPPADAARQIVGRLVYAGDTAQARGGVDVVPWRQIQRRDWATER